MLRSGLIVAALLAIVELGAGAAAAPPALADPPWTTPGDHDRGWGRAAQYQVAGGPPPWAPAHGYRRKAERKRNHHHRHHHDHDHDHDHGHKDRHARAEPRVIDLDLGRCNRDLIGAVLGGAVGGVIGSQIGEGAAGRAIATAGGVIVGAVVGGAIGRKMDEGDRGCVAYALDLAPQDRAVRWDNPETGVRYELTPLGPYRAKDGRSCREYATRAVADGKPHRSRGVACRRPDGAWQIAS